ncbi:MAG: DUF5696 domain-containing protein [Saccharofermentanales bacterium]
MMIKKKLIAFTVLLTMAFAAAHSGMYAISGEAGETSESAAVTDTATAALPAVAPMEEAKLNEISLMDPVAESGRYALYVFSDGERAGEFCLTDNVDRLYWFSNPLGKENIKGVKGSPKFEMFSQLVIYGFDEATNTEKTINSYIGTNRGETVAIALSDDGFEAVYEFPDDQLIIPVQVTLTDDGLHVICETGKIRENGTFHAIRISLVPYLGSGGTDSKGYIVVPDGSGALIRFNNGKEQADKFSMRIYGEDPSLSEEMKTSETKTASLPVFGISNDQTGLLGIVSQGDANALIVAQTSGQRNPQNCAYAEFILRNKDTVVVGESALTQTKQVIKYDMDHILSETIGVDYYPLPKDEFTYSDMANRYRQLLIEQGLSATAGEKDISLTAEFYGGVYKQKTFLGLTFKSFEVLTDFGDLDRIRSELKEEGIEHATYLYNQWNSSEIQGKIQNEVRPDRRLGTTRELSEIVNPAVDTLYLSYSPFFITRNGKGFVRFFHAAKRLSREPVLLYTYKKSTNYRDLSIPPGYLPELSKLSGTVRKFIADASGSGLGNLYMPDFGSLLYTDFNEKSYKSRDDLMAEIGEILQGIEMNIMMKTPNAYALKYADRLVELSYSASSYDVEDETIPFYQLAVSGVVPYSLDAINLGGNPRRTILQSIETGADPYFTWIAEDGATLQETALNRLYGSDYELWKKYAVDAYNEMRGVFEKIGSRTMKSHEWIEPDVSRTVFANGGSVIVNYNDEAVETAYGTIEGNGYLAASGE